MRLNSDCVRSILLTVESKCDFHKFWHYRESEELPEQLSEYSHDEILYHIKQCELSELILGVTYCDGGSNVYISDLSPEGHKFLANIREDTVWNGVKSVAKKVGSTSLSAITQIASNVVTELIKAQFKIT